MAFLLFLKSTVNAHQIAAMGFGCTFLDCLRKSNAIVAGSFVLHLFLEQKAAEPHWFPNDMDVWVPFSSRQPTHLLHLYRYLTGKHYILKSCSGSQSGYRRFQETVTQCITFERTCGWPTERMESKSMSDIAERRNPRVQVILLRHRMCSQHEFRGMATYSRSLYKVFGARI